MIARRLSHASILMAGLLLGLAAGDGTLAAFSDATSNPGNTFTAADFAPCTVTNGSTSTAKVGDGDITIASPSNVEVGDILIAQIARQGGVRSMTPSGWTLVVADASGSDVAQHIYYKPILTAGDAGVSNYTWNTAGKASGGIIVYKGVDLDGPINGSVPAGLTGDASTYRAPSINPADPDGMRLAFFSVKKDTAISQASDMTERYEVRNDQDLSISLNDQPLGTSGATSEKSVSGIQDKWVGHSLALTPAPPGSC